MCIAWGLFSTQAVLGRTLPLMVVTRWDWVHLVLKPGVVLGGDSLSGLSSKGLILDMHASPSERPLEVSLSGGPPSTDLIDAEKEVVELRTGYASEIRPPSGMVRSRWVVPLGGSTRWGISLSPSLFDPILALWSVWPTNEGPHGHPISRITAGECEVQPWTWAWAYDL
jgi:hypothetical protein